MGAELALDALLELDFAAGFLEEDVAFTLLLLVSVMTTLQCPWCCSVCGSDCAVIRARLILHPCLAQKTNACDNPSLLTS